VLLATRGMLSSHPSLRNFSSNGPTMIEFRRKAKTARPHLTDVSYLHLHLQECFAMVYPEATAAMLRQEFSQ
jgi:hypothetical protein